MFEHVNLPLPLMAFGVLAMAVTKVARRTALAALHRIAHVTTLAILIGCALGAAWPDLLPVAVRRLADPAVATLGCQLPADWPPWAAWFLLAAVVSIAAVPILEVLSFARVARQHADLLTALRRDLAEAVNRLERAPPAQVAALRRVFSPEPEVDRSQSRPAPPSPIGWPDALQELLGTKS
jgi:hypothetical protein